MAVLENCTPKDVFSYFEKLSAIPRGSGNTKAVSDYCVSFAKEHSLEWKQNEKNNVIIYKKATPGYEDAPAIILQGHLDMVCVKRDGSTHDFMRDGIELIHEGDEVRAKDTTLGADNGIAVAMALAILADDSLEHPAIEALFTADEETGMFGAETVDFSELRGRKLINIDSEEEGEIIAGCAGGIRADCSVPVVRKKKIGSLCRVTVDGLLGGHSGSDIDKGRGSSNRLMGRLLYEIIRKIPFGIISMSGGTVENAIAAKTDAEIIVSPEYIPALREVTCRMANAFSGEFSSADPDVQITLEECDCVTLDATDAESTERIARILTALPAGVQEMSDDIPGLVQTSLNMGVLRLGEEGLSMRFSVRSSVKTEKEWLCRRICAITELAGGSVSFESDYPAWEFRKVSPLRELVVECSTELYGKPPRINAIHAGLECGIFSGKAPELDCVSLGPDLHNVHSPDEKLSVSSVERTYELLKLILKKAK